MLSVSLSRTTHQVKNPVKFNKYENPAPESISSLWAELSTLATFVPAGEAGGVHRLRSRLLDGVESWRLPEVLDQLSEATA